MWFSGKRVAVSAMLITLSAASTARAGDASWVIAAYEHSDAPASYTFHMDLALAMHHFPWMHFHVSGDGAYNKGKKYEVQFTHVPMFFGNKMQKVDLSMIDPSMWEQRYHVDLVGKDGDATVFSLHSLDPQSGLVSALVTLNPDCTTRAIDVKYNDGTHITLNLTANQTAGYVLPSNGNAEISMPHMALSAQADFTDYNFNPAPSSPSPPQ